jgi:RNA polymerase sigma factor (sigma-70 family)
VDKVRTEDGALIYKCLNEEPDAFGMLVDKYKAGIYAFVYNKLGNFQDAEDVTQETFLEAFKNLRKLKNWDSFAIWLFSIASNLSKGWIRSLSKRPDREFIEDKDPKVLNDPSIELYRDGKISESLNEALESLPDIYRQVLTLHYLGGMSGLDIARSLGISHDTVRQRLLRAREQLKEEMIAMMSQTFQQQKLSASFTFRVVEMLKNIRIHPNSSIKGLPWGLSLGTGLIFTLLMFGQHIQINLPDIAMGLPLPSEMKVLKVGEISVDAVKASTITSIGNKGDGKGVAPDPKGQENAFFMSPQAEGKWEKRADMPTARNGLRTETVGGKIYALGGWGPPDVSLSIVEEYNPIENKWEIKSNMLEERLYFSANSANGKIYAFGGISKGDQIISSVEEYDPILDKWTKKKDMPKPLMMHASCTSGSKIFVVGGWNGVDLDTVYEYDLFKDSWTERAKMPTARGAFGICAINEKIYAIGGFGENHTKKFSIVEEYDPVTDKWNKKSDMPTQRGYYAACVVGTRIYILGGTQVGPDDVGMETVEIYDTLTDTWTKGEDMLIPKCAFSASAVDGKIFSIGGWSGRMLSDVEEFDTGIIESNSVDPSGKLPKTWGMLKAK